jgi:hypothetical protein
MPHLIRRLTQGTSLEFNDHEYPPCGASHTELSSARLSYVIIKFLFFPAERQKTVLTIRISIALRRSKTPHTINHLSEPRLHMKQTWRTPHDRRPTRGRERGRGMPEPEALLVHQSDKG